VVIGQEFLEPVTHTYPEIAARLGLPVIVSSISRAGVQIFISYIEHVSCDSYFIFFVVNTTIQFKIVW
jgi:hypothetical protein